MIILGFNILGNLNKSATSVSNLGLPLWRIVIASGILSSLMGLFNIIAVSKSPWGSSIRWHLYRLSSSAIRSKESLVAKYVATVLQSRKSPWRSPSVSPAAPRVELRPPFYQPSTPRMKTDGSRGLAWSSRFGYRISLNLSPMTPSSSKNGSRGVRPLFLKSKDRPQPCIHTTPELLKHLTQHLRDTVKSAIWPASRWEGVDWKKHCTGVLGVNIFSLTKYPLHMKQNCTGMGNHGAWMFLPFTCLCITMNHINHANFHLGMWSAN